ncbi:MAG: transposase [Candidatus Dormibacteraeota bacterium]|nr:transposase [Candidatus Dormibacteraeota bacterium]
MEKTYLPYDQDQLLLLPPSVREWVKPGDRAHLIDAVVECLDLTAIEAVYEAELRGAPPYHPVMMTKLWLYAYAVGVTSSRRLAKLVQRDVGVMMLAAGNRPGLINGPMRIHSAGTSPSGHQAHRPSIAECYSDGLLDGAFGPGWQAIIERVRPGAVAQAAHDAPAALGVEAAALQVWPFGPDQLREIRIPMLSVVHADPARPGFQEIHVALLGEGADALEVDLPSHLLQIIDPAPVARGVADFLTQHPLPR